MKLIGLAGGTIDGSGTFTLSKNQSLLDLQGCVGVKVTKMHIAGVGTHRARRWDAIRDRLEATGKALYFIWTR